MGTPIYCRLIQPKETALIETATAINNEVWGKELTSTVDEFRSRAQLGYLVGAFGPSGLLGTISGLELPTAALSAAAESSRAAQLPANPLPPGGGGQGGGAATRLCHPLSTWEGATANGTFRSAVPGADALCCVAVTSREAAKPSSGKAAVGLPEMKPGPYTEWAEFLLGSRDPKLPAELEALADRLLPAYLQSNLDPVLRFHARDKGPLPGARPWLPIPKGRPADAGSLGYNVLMRYPELTPQAREALLAPSDYAPTSIGEALVLGAARVAATLPSVKWVVPYSRPAAFRKDLGRLLARISGAAIPFSRPEEQTFATLTSWLAPGPATP